MPLPVNKMKEKGIAVEFSSVDFSYQATSVLKQVSFQVYEGEFIGIIGPNGGGKTTLLKLALGFLRPSAGAVRAFGAKAGSPSVAGSIAYVPQSIRFDRDFPISVEEVVLSGLLSHLPWYGRFHAQERKSAQEILEKMDLESLSKYSFGSLSGGQAQRVLIARALVSKPKLLLLDEPTASVDVQAESDIYALLNQLKGSITIIMVTHDLKTAIDHVQRVLCVQGSVVSLKPNEVCKHFTLGLYHMPLLQSSQ
jgi:zinc transport system ATP-binding protein